MSICPTCERSFADDVATCPSDGAVLLPATMFASMDHALAPGTLVGEYRVEGKLGEGGFGAVYRAVHPLIGKSAAIKVLNREFSSNPQMVSRFIAEARAVNQIRHRNIIDVFAFGALPDGRQYYVMELLDGAGFDVLIKLRGRLSPSEAIPILRGIARALDAAHKSGIVHRDLKPENVYLVADEDGQLTPKLLDFGIAKLAPDGGQTHKTKTGTAMGTPYYMSPEQTRGVSVDHRTDLYSFGVMVFEALTGSVPFQGESTMDILVKHLNQVPPRVSSLVPELAPVDDVVARMLAKEPDARHRSAGDAVTALAAAFQFPDAARDNSQPSLTAALRSDAVISQGPGDLGPESRGMAKTTPVGKPVALGEGAPVADPHGQTFLSAETDIAKPGSPAAPPPRGKLLPLVVGVVALCAGVGVAAALATRPAKDASAGTMPSAPASIAAPSLASAAASDVPPATPDLNDADHGASVKVRVEGAPDGAEVLADGKLLGVAPGPFDLPRGKASTLTVRANGYQSTTVVARGAPDERVQAPLQRAPKTAPPTKINKDLESPF